MKATFFYDIRFMKYKNSYYSHYGVNDSLLQRYLNIFTEFTYVGREELVNESNKKYLTENNKITKSKIVTFDGRYKNVKKIVKEEVDKAEFVIIRMPSIVGYYAQKFCENKKVPYLVEVVGNAFESLWYRGLKTKILALPIHLMMKKVVKNSKYVSYITDNYLQSCYPTKYQSFSGIANVSLKKVDETVLHNKLMTIDKIDRKNTINIGMIGALNVKYKGHLTALKAIKIVKSSFPNIKLMLLGQGDSKTLEIECKKLGVVENVEYCGTLPGGDSVLKWLDNIDIYIQPSITEGHGRSVVEAMSRGCITFGSNVGGIPDSLREEYLFPKNDYKKLAGLIINAISDKHYAKTAATNNFRDSKKYEESVIEKKRQHAFEMAMKQK